MTATPDRLKPTKTTLWLLFAASAGLFILGFAILGSADGADEPFYGYLSMMIGMVTLFIALVLLAVRAMNRILALRPRE
jgi:peptidoglycan/LPS O-acetylase OafA/YrhL